MNVRPVAAKRAKGRGCGAKEKTFDNLKSDVGCNPQPCVNQEQVRPVLSKPVTTPGDERERVIFNNLKSDVGCNPQP